MKLPKLFHIADSVKFTGLSLVIVFAIQAVFGQERKTDVRQLKPNQIVEREMSGAETHNYKFTLQKNDFLQVRVEQKGIDVVVRILNTSGKLFTEMDSPNGTQGFEDLSFITLEAGTYICEVSSLDKNAAKGKYTIFLETPRTTTDKDIKKIKAKTLYDEAISLVGQGKIESYRAATVKFQEAIELYRESGDKSSESQALFYAALVLHNLGDKRTALKYFEQASLLFESLGDTNIRAIAVNNIANIYDELGEKQKALSNYGQALKLNNDITITGAILNNIGKIYVDWGNHQTAVEYYEKSLSFRRTSGDKRGEGLTLHNYGTSYDLRGETQKAIEYYKEALALHKIADNKPGEATTLNNLGNAYSALGDTQKGVDYLNQALEILVSLPNNDKQAVTLTSIGRIYATLGEKGKALDYYDKASLLYRDSEDKKGIAITLHYTGLIYLQLGELKKALKYFEQALPLLKEIGSKNEEADVLTGMSRVYADLGDKQKALDRENQALQIFKITENKSAESFALTGLGLIHFDFDEYAEALKYYEQALPQHRSRGSKFGEALSLTGIGSVSFRTGDYQKAFDNLKKALPLYRATGNRHGEVETLYNLMIVSEAKGNLKLAVFYGKQSLNKRQELRDMARTLDYEIQKSFLRNFIFAYQSLAEILIMKGQTPQAVEVLNLYQDQQFFDFNRELNNFTGKIPFSPQEQDFANRYETSVQKVGQIDLQIEELNRQLSNRKLNNQETAQLEKLKAEFKTATDIFLNVLQDAETEFAKSADVKDKIPDTLGVMEMQTALRELEVTTKQKPAALYTLIAYDKFYIILITQDGIKTFNYPITADNLNKKILQFYALLQSPTYDPQPLGKELYNIIFKAVEAELKKSGVKTLMWQLDGNLRYIPVAALFDGKEYLAEKYQNVIFTRADKKRITKAVSRDWTGIGFGSSQAQKITLPNETVEISFSPLPGAAKELTSIFRPDNKSKGILNGEVFSNKKFTKTAFYEAVKQKRPVNHVSSHFTFRPGDSSRSFLVLGDGSTLTLNEMKEQKNLFEKVELLTLSACSTAATYPDASGREIDGFAELAQRLGANAVIATLWQVRDESTAQLITGFYKNRQIQKFNKAEALRQAQLDLLYGKSKKTSDSVNNQNTLPSRNESPIEDTFIEKIYRVPFKPDTEKPFAHPYYWSPFVLFGNWK